MMLVHMEVHSKVITQEHIIWSFPNFQEILFFYNLKRLPKFERCVLSLLTATPTVPGHTPHPVGFCMPHAIKLKYVWKNSEID